MRKSLSNVLGATAVLGTALLTTTAASAAPHARAAPAQTCIEAGDNLSGSCTTIVTFTVNTGALSITAPATADLGNGPPTSTVTGTPSIISSTLGGGGVVVTDDRAALAPTWTVTASATDWTTGGGTSAETIPATDATYTPGAITTTGSVTATGTTITLANAPTGAAGDVVTGTGVGNNTAAWDPTIAVTVPSAAVAGLYTGTLTQSVA